MNNKRDPNDPMTAIESSLASDVVRLTRERDELRALLLDVWSTIPAEFTGLLAEVHAAALNRIPAALAKSPLRASVLYQPTEKP